VSSFLCYCTETGEQLAELLEKTNEHRRVVKSLIDKMRGENDKLASSGSSEARIRANMCNTLSKKFVDLMTHYEEVQTKYKNKQRERVERQIRIGKGGVCFCACVLCCTCIV